MIVNGNELLALMEQRWSTLRELLEFGNRQIAAIESQRMSELMRLLSEKQTPLNRLAQVAASIRQAADDDPAARQWDSEETRVRCRRRQEECEQLHLQLLAIEAECETALTESREFIQKKLDRVDAGQQAANSYADSQATPTQGGQLDLSSN
jgi:hypothetical protein